LKYPKKERKSLCNNNNFFVKNYSLLILISVFIIIPENKNQRIKYQTSSGGTFTYIGI